jgi:hypothetical protein
MLRRGSLAQQVMPAFGRTWYVARNLASAASCHLLAVRRRAANWRIQPLADRKAADMKACISDPPIALEW